MDKEDLQRKCGKMEMDLQLQMKENQILQLKIQELQDTVAELEVQALEYMKTADEERAHLQQLILFSQEFSEKNREILKTESEDIVQEEWKQIKEIVQMYETSMWQIKMKFQKNSRIGNWNRSWTANGYGQSNEYILIDLTDGQVQNE